jgi:hypothetical protein
VYEPAADPRHIERGAEHLRPTSETLEVLASQFHGDSGEKTESLWAGQIILQQSPYYLGAEPTLDLDRVVNSTYVPVYSDSRYGVVTAPSWRGPSPRIPWWSIIPPICQ